MNVNAIAQTLIKHGPAIHEAYMTVGDSITSEQQAFVLANWKSLPQFLKTEGGKVAMQTFVGDWMEGATKKAG